MPFNGELLSRLGRRSPLVVFDWQIATWVKQLPELDPKRDIALQKSYLIAAGISPLQAI